MAASDDNRPRRPLVVLDVRPLLLSEALARVLTNLGIEVATARDGFAPDIVVTSGVVAPVATTGPLVLSLSRDAPSNVVDITALEDLFARIDAWQPEDVLMPAPAVGGLARGTPRRS